ncbi:MAG: FkbM family methyltransferase [Nitrospiraceae bacterium]
MTTPTPVIGDDGLMFQHGMYWPVNCRSFWYSQTANDMDKALPFVKGRSVVVQAGGNVGAWPKWLASRFDHVYTFEPEPSNFRALCRNVPESNVYRAQGALGNSYGTIAMDIDPVNIGGHSVSSTVGHIPTYRVDDLKLSACDLIVLDVEGFEYHVLMGSINTILMFHPVIMLEFKGHADRYGGQDLVAYFMEKYHYNPVAVVKDDRIYAYLGGV